MIIPADAPMIGTVALVLGARGPAAEAARALAAAGAELVVMDRDTAAGHALVLDINIGNRGVALFVPGDPDSADDRATALAETRAAWGRLDLVVAPPADTHRPD